MPVNCQTLSTKTWPNATICLVHNNVKIYTKTLKDGYFKFCIPLSQLEYGWIGLCKYRVQK
jgi:hypothetical protein